jgi:hypothetical protein
VNQKSLDERAVNEHIEFLTDTAILTRNNKISPRKSFRSEFLEKVKLIIDIDRTKKIDHNKSSTNAEYERFE